MSNVCGSVGLVGWGLVFFFLFVFKCICFFRELTEKKHQESSVFTSMNSKRQLSLEGNDHIAPV